MQITIELLNDNALNLIHDLEKMHIVRLIKTVSIAPTTPADVAQKPSKRFAGHISKETADELQEQLEAYKTDVASGDLKTQKVRALSYSDFSFAKTRKILENVTTSISDEIIEERRSAL